MCLPGAREGARPGRAPEGEVLCCLVRHHNEAGLAPDGKGTPKPKRLVDSPRGEKHFKREASSRSKVLLTKVMDWKGTAAFRPLGEDCHRGE